MNYIFNGKYNSSFMMQERMSFIKMISVYVFEIEKKKKKKRISDLFLRKLKNEFYEKNFRYVFGTEDKRMNFIKRISYLFFEIENKRMNI